MTMFKKAKAKNTKLRFKRLQCSVSQKLILTKKYSFVRMKLAKSVTKKKLNLEWICITDWQKYFRLNMSSQKFH